MDQLLADLLSFPPEKQVSPQEFDKQATAYVRSVTNLHSTAWRTKSEKKNKTLLDILDPVKDSIPYLFCLLDRLKAHGSDRQELATLMPYIRSFLTKFNPVQARYVGAQWRALLSSTADVYRTLGIPDVSPLGDAILRLDPSAGTLTTNHLTYLILCLQAGTPSKALRILDKNTYAFPPDSKNSSDDCLAEEHELSSTFINERSGISGKLTPADVLQYYLLGAHVYIGVKQWSRAQLFLELAILHPSPSGSTSTLQTEAYKKWVLVGLIHQGKKFAYPRTVGQQVMKNVRAVSRPYDALAETFERRDWRKFNAEQDVGANIWFDDGNKRLVHEAGKTLVKYCIFDLQRTYAALPISRVAAHLGLSPADTQSMVTGLIQSGQLSGMIDSSSADATLRFSLAPDSSNIEELTIESQTQRIEELLRHVRDADRRLQSTKEYIDLLRRAKRQGNETDPADQMDLEYASTSGPIVMPDEDGDEDIMA